MVKLKDIAEHCGISVTQVLRALSNQDDVKKGYCAAKLLYEILNQKNEENTIVVPCEIIERQSSKKIFVFCQGKAGVIGTVS